MWSYILLEPAMGVFAIYRNLTGIDTAGLGDLASALASDVIFNIIYVDMLPVCLFRVYNKSSCVGCTVTCFTSPSFHVSTPSIRCTWLLGREFAGARKLRATKELPTCYDQDVSAIIQPLNVMCASCHFS
jgi:hypothetical protein